jgi:hypothetical protein
MEGASVTHLPLQAGQEVRVRAKCSDKKPNKTENKTMKAAKIIGRLIVGCVLACCLSHFTLQTFAIEGLRVSVQSTNAVLSWPSDYTSADTYLIQSCSNLTTSSWTILSDNVYPDYGTNITYFVDTNPVVYPASISGGGSTNGGVSIDPNNTNNTTGFSGGTNSFPSATCFYRVVRDGAHLFGLTNGAVLSGVVKFPIELANDGGTVSTVSITENETPIGNSTQIAPAIAPLSATLDTTLLANGVHMISASARWDDTNGGLWEAESPAISVTISNEISFENWMPSFGETGNTFLFRATSAHTNTDWVVSVYDSSNTYLGYFSGHTDDGDISFYYDYSGTSLTNNPKFSFEISTEYVDPPTPPTYKVTDPWTAEGAWAMAAQHAFDNASDSDTLYKELNGFVGVAGSIGGVSPPASSDGSPYALAFNDPSGDGNWASFRSAIFNSTTRNLVYFGHGGQTGIGYNTSNTNRFISSTEIANVLHTIPTGQTNRHAFRFVFIDACSTALGAMPESFGILHKENVLLTDYQAASLRPSAYVGWPKDKMIGILNGAYINYDHVNFISHIQLEMILNSKGIKDAIAQACNYPDVHGSFGPEDLKVYGDWLLHVGEANN